MSDDPVIVWFRRDLRVADNPALRHAAEQQRPVLPVYVTGWEDGHGWAPGTATRWWLRRSLDRLAESLTGLGTPLIFLTGPAEEAIPRLAGELGATQVIWNRLYEPYSRGVEDRLTAALGRRGVAARAFNAALLFEPDERLSRLGRPFSQFTAFWRNCLSTGEPGVPQPEPERLIGVDGAADLAAGRPVWAAEEWRPYATAAESWTPGEAGAQARLARFIETRVAGYHSARDFPGVEGTSRLSPHLHFGEIGPRQVWKAVQGLSEGAPARGRRPAPGPVSFLRQLGWREFAHYLLFHFPHIAELPFRPEFVDFPWEDDPAGLEAWKQGETGYPLVDAGMRQLLAEGWMHNRARMVVASFLTKDLLIPWQSGAAWFWDRLVDADLANNTLGWQWTAGSGPDAAPFFRVFNPVLQAARFDADGAYTRTWSAAPGGLGEGRVSPRPIVDHGEARARALAAFRGLKRS